MVEEFLDYFAHGDPRKDLILVRKGGELSLEPKPDSWHPVDDITNIIGSAPHATGDKNPAGHLAQVLKEYNSLLANYQGK